MAESYRGLENPDVHTVQYLTSESLELHFLLRDWPETGIATQ